MRHCRRRLDSQSSEWLPSGEGALLLDVAQGDPAVLGMGRVDGEAETRVHLDGEPFGMLPVDIGVAAAAVAVAAPIG